MSLGLQAACASSIHRQCTGAQGIRYRWRCDKSRVARAMTAHGIFTVRQHGRAAVSKSKRVVLNKKCTDVGLKTEAAIESEFSGICDDYWAGRLGVSITRHRQYHFPISQTC